MKSIHGSMKSMSSGLPMNARHERNKERSWKRAVRLSSVSTDEVRKWGKWGSSDSDPICPTLKRNPKKSAAFRRSWGKWGLRARIKWRRSTILLLYAQDNETDIHISSLGIMATLAPTRPKPLFSAAFAAQ